MIFLFTKVVSLDRFHHVYLLDKLHPIVSGILSSDEANTIWIQILDFSNVIQQYIPNILIMDLAILGFAGV